MSYIPPSTLLGFLMGVWPTIRAACRVIISFGGLMLVLWGLLSQFGDLETALNATADRIDSLSALIQALPTHSVMNRLNVIFPMTEFLGFILGYLGLQVACVLVRWTKAAILFWSGG